jgi:diguanylate cyclase (GGDEF)-like protein/PAS domain S-box-containing protein
VRPISLPPDQSGLNGRRLGRGSRPRIAVPQPADGAFPDPSTYWELFWFAPVCYLVTDTDGVVREANAAAEALLRVARSDLIGRSLMRFVDPLHRTELRRRLIRLARGDIGTDWEVELALAPPAGPLVASIAIGEAHDRAGTVASLGWVLQDITDRKRFESRIAHLAYHDSLTGLPNRAMFDEFLTIALARARRAGTAVALLCLDLDGFKAVNDRLGHAAGDDVLRQVGRRLLAVSRGSDVVGRRGGDEFAVLLADLDMPDMGRDVAHRGQPEQVADRIRKALRPPCVVGDGQVRVSASIGIGVFPVHAGNEADLVASADAAMYEAKRDGRRATGPPLGDLRSRRQAERAEPPGSRGLTTA